MLSHGAGSQPMSRMRDGLWRRAWMMRLCISSAKAAARSSRRVCSKVLGTIVSDDFEYGSVGMWENEVSDRRWLNLAFEMQSSMKVII